MVSSLLRKRTYEERKGGEVRGGFDGKTKQRKREFSMSHLFCTTISN